MPGRLHVFSLLTTILALTACAQQFSPNVYSSNAVQLANKVEAGTIVGYREVRISATGNIGAVTGGAAGGILGAEYADSALAAVGGSAVGALVGNTLDHAAGDTTGWEYIVRKFNSDLLSVTQREKRPLALGQKVLVIMGPQARVVPDYSVIPDSPPPTPVVQEKVEIKPDPPVKVEVVLTLPPGVTVQPANPSAAPVLAETAQPNAAPPESTAPAEIRNVDLEDLVASIAEDGTEMPAATEVVLREGAVTPTSN